MEPQLTLDDRAALTDLVQRYAHLVDARDFVAVSGLFEPDGVLRAPAPPDHLGPHRTVQGADAIGAELAQLTHFETTVHALTGHLFEAVQDDEAVGHVRCEAHHVSTHSSGVRDLVWLLRYTDRYRRSEGRWRFAERALHVDVIEVREVKRVAPRPAP